MKNIKIYSTSTCHYCNLAKKYFDDNNIKYTNIDLVENQDKRDELLKHTNGQLLVPVILIDEEVILGFDKNKFEEIYNK